MGRGSKTLYRAGAGAAFLVALLLGLAVIVPRVVDSAWLKETIRTEVARQVNGSFDFQEAELIILPLPAVSLTQVSLAIPDSAEVNLETLTIYPKLLPLLIGSIQINKIVIIEPGFSLPLPQKQKKEQQKSLSLAETLKAVSAKLSPILSAIQGLKVGVNKGTLRLFAGDEQFFLFENINGSFTVTNKGLTSTLSCESNIWESMELQGTLTPVTGAGKGSISLKNLSTKVLSDYFLQTKLTIPGASFSSLEADFTFNPESGLTADIQSSGSSFTALQENKKITANVEYLKGSIKFSDLSSAITVDDLSLSQPRGQFSGSFKYNRSIPLASLDINSQNADITGIREVLSAFVKALYGDLPVLQDIFAILRGGTIARASIHVEGKTPPDLAVFESMLIQGQVKDAEVQLADLGLDLQGVTGDVAINEGILEGSNLQARLGNSTGSGGTLKLGLMQKKSTPFHLDLDIIADLAEVPPLLIKLVPKKQVLEYLALIETVEGTAQGRLTLGESLESLTARVEVKTISAQVSYKPIPYLITIDGGRILYDGLKTQSFDLQGKVGSSTFSNFSSRMNFEGEPIIEVESGSFHLVLDEIFPWLAKDKRLADELKDIQNVTGLAEITVKSLQGPLLQPANLLYEMQCSLNNVSISATLLPGLLTIKSGRANIAPDKITFENLQAGLLDSSFTYSGVLQNFLKGKTNANVIITNATIGQELNSWFTEQINTPTEYILRTPLLISRSNVKWIREELLDLQGDLSIRNGPIFSFDIMLNQDEMILRNFTIKNDDEQASMRLDLKKRTIGAEFQGSLSKKTVDAVLLHNDVFPDAWIKGDIRFHIYLDSPARSIATGNLEGGDFIFPWKLEKPLLLSSFSLSAADKTLTLNSAEAVFEAKSYDIQGTASLTQERLDMNFDVATDAIELDKIFMALPEEAAEKSSESGKIGKSWDLGIIVQVNIHADSLLYNGYTWKPLESRLTLENSSLDVEILNAELCNIATPGKISLRNGQISLDFKMAAEDEEFRDVLTCLVGGEQQMTGLLDLKASIRGEGTRDTLANSLSGDLQFSAEKGRIYQDAHMAKLLYVLNVTNLFQGKIPDLAANGFDYDSLIVKGVMDKGILTIAPARLNAPILEIAAKGAIDIPGEKVDLLVLVAPLQTINKLQNLLPVINKIVPESLVAVPVEVKGHFSDIKVKTLSMSAISKSVFGAMVDDLSTPVRLLEGTSGKTP